MQKIAANMASITNEPTKQSYDLLSKVKVNVHWRMRFCCKKLTSKR